MKTIRLIALVLIVLSLALAFASCGGSGATGEPESDDLVSGNIMTAEKTMPEQQNPFSSTQDASATEPKEPTIEPEESTIQPKEPSATEPKEPTIEPEESTIQPEEPIDCQPSEPSVGIAFASNGDGSCCVSGIGTCTDTDVVIPSTSPEGDCVTTIKRGAFSDCYSMTSVTIPDSVSNIEEYAFSGCSNLTNVIFAENNQLTSIGNAAFSSCSAITNIIVPDSVTSIGWSAFWGCSCLESITIPFVGAKAGITDAYQYPFGYIFGTGNYLGGTETKQEYLDDSGFSTSSTFHIPSSLKSVTVTGGNIPKGAFHNCSGLTSITLPDSVTSIGYYAFCNCSGLTSLTIPDSVTKIENSAFNGCDRLMEVHNLSSLNVKLPGRRERHIYKEGKSYLHTTDDGFVFYDNGMNVYLIQYNGTETDLTLPREYNNNHYEINRFAFEGCSSLTSITIPDSVTSIGGSAFEGCTNLTSITIPNSVTSIASGAFRYCYRLIEVCNLSSLEIVAGSSDNGLVGYYAKHVYKNGESYLHTTDNGYVFYDDGMIIYLIQHIGAQTELTLPGNYNGKQYEISQYAFYGCSNLTSITVPFVGATKGGESNTHFGYIFGASSYKDNSSCVPSSLRTVVITGGTSIDTFAFYGCAKLTSVTIPNSVTSIGTNAFNNCERLTSITIPNSVKSVGSQAFEGCVHLIEVRNLSSLTISAGSKDNGYVGYYAKHVYMNGESYLYTIDDGFLFYNDGNDAYLMRYNGNQTELILPTIDNVRNYAIYRSAFLGCGCLNSVTIPDCVTSVGAYAFNDCNGLTSVMIGKGVTIIGYRAFQDCNGLTHLTIGNGVTKIEDEAFQNCNDLTSVVFAENSQLEMIGWYAFSGCRSLTSITIPSSVRNITWHAFTNCSGLTSVTFEKNSQLTIIGDEVFSSCSSLTNITIPSKVTSIGKHAFSNCRGLTSITIPNGVTDIGEGAFSGCCGLESINVTSGNTKYQSKGNCLIRGKTLILGCKNSIIPTDGSVMTIGAYAFSGCSGLTTISIPSTVTSIEQYAFAGCSNLTSITIPNSVTSILWDAFSSCSSLTSITIPNSVTSIRDDVFHGCSSLISITIPSNVTSIGKYAFSGCSSLIKVTFSNTSGWYVSQSQNASSGTNITVTNATTNATNLVSTYDDFHWYRK